MVGTPSLLATSKADASGVATITLTVPRGLPVGAAAAFQAVALRGAGNADSAKSNPVARSLLAAVPQPIDGTSDLVITEVMANPDAVVDADGEWFELHNLG